MNRKLALLSAAVVVCGIVTGISLRSAETARGPIFRSPLALALDPSAKTLYVADHTADQVCSVVADKGTVAKSGPVPGATGLAVTRDGKRVYAASATTDKVIMLDAATMKPLKSVVVGRNPYGLTLSPDGATLYACEQFSNTVAVIDTAKMKVTKHLKATREPRFCALAEGGKTLVVSNQIPTGSNLDDNLGAGLSVIDLASGAKTDVQLARGATDVGQVVVSSDGKYAFVVHVLARWLVPPTQLDRGWISTNALTIVDVAARKRLNTCLIDDLDRGAANGYGLAFSPDGSTLYTTQSGTDEVQIVDVAKLMKLMTEWPADSPVALEDDLTAVYRAGVRQRVPAGGTGPRGLVATADTVYVANYYSGQVACMDARTGKVARTIAIGNQPAMDAVRKGEMLFNSASVCFQNWQSCASCHPDARTDGLAWDLLNDGIGNPKNAKSMLLSAKTPPVMAHGIRDTMDIAIASGFKFIQFHVPQDDEITSVSAYLTSLAPARSPYRLADGSLSPAAKRGKVVFDDPKVGCATCHPGPLFTDLKSYNTATTGPYDSRDDFDTPTLIEVWRTAPYLHDGGVDTMREVFGDRNKTDKHGVTSHLSSKQMDDLVEYVMSL